MPRSHRSSSGETKKTSASWEVLKSEEVFAAPPWIRLSVQEVRLPDGRVVGEYHQITLAEFVIIVAQTSDMDVIVERQYKHGVGDVTLVLPGGMREEGEEPLACAQRELLEETGYVSDSWRALGRFVVNGNYGCGTAHVFLARNARRVADPNSGDLAETEVILMTPQSIAHAVSDGSLVLLSSVAALALATNPLFSTIPGDMR